MDKLKYDPLNTGDDREGMLEHFLPFFIFGQ